MINIVPVNDKKQLKAFIDFPHDLYQGDVNYVPELHIAQRDLLTPGKHPFHEHSTLQLFLAYNDSNKIVGRIAAINNGNHNTFNNANDGFFGFFDCIDDYTVAECLFSEAYKWLKEKGLSTMIGPVNPSTNEPCGLLIEGHDAPPVIMMTYNKPYYATFLEQYGFKKNVDLLAWNITPQTVTERAVRLHQALEKRLAQRGITIRKVNLKDLKNEIPKLLDVYNSAWDKNMGFVPLTENEFKYLVNDLKLVADDDFVLIAEQEGEAAGIALALPDINQILRKVHRGRLLPTGIFKLLFGKKKINYLRVIALGVKEKYRKMGIEACFYATIIEKGLKKGMVGAEGSWILEHNTLMNSTIQDAGGEVYKKYRIYELGIKN